MKLDGLPCCVRICCGLLPAGERMEAGGAAGSAMLQRGRRTSTVPTLALLIAWVEPWLDQLEVGCETTERLSQRMLERRLGRHDHSQALAASILDHAAQEGLLHLWRDLVGGAGLVSRTKRLSKVGAGPPGLVA